MGFWSNLFGNPNHAGVTANANPLPSTVGESGYTPGDPDGVDLVGFDTPTEARALPRLLPSPWSGWPASWDVPNWDFGSRLNELIDIAWACLDLNSRVLSAMPVYRTKGGKVATADTWMTNPDPMIYSSWAEFAKQLFWDFQLGEAFVLPMGWYSDGWPMRFRVIPPYLMHVEMANGARRYRLGGPAGTEVTNDILHIRYTSTTDSPHGKGPLEVAGGRMLTAGILAKYAREVASTGGVPAYTLETNEQLSKDDAQDMLEHWVATRARNLGYPPVLDNAVTLKTHMAMSPKDMAMVEISQLNEGRIADLLGVPRILMGLPAGDSMTYSNVSSLFDFHDRASLRPFATHVMSAMSNWALPRGQAVELNRDEYTRPAFNERADAWVKLKGAGLASLEQFQAAERLAGAADLTVEEPAIALTGGEV